MALADPARWERLKALLADAADLDPDARAAFLDRLGDAELRADLDGLLAAHDEAEAADRFEEPALGAEVGPSVRNRLPDDARVGPYRLAGEVGQGGMGTVFRAERADGAFEQTVALKVLSHAFASPDAARRFRAERQILARLEHPHVARLLDGGVAAGGPLGRDLPWLAMEFVDGVPLTAYVREAGLRVEGRVRLFLQVCEAVAYAHRNLVVHRDLKPSNILVAEDDRRAPQAKLLDFGIAKLVGKDLGSDAASLAEALTRTGMQVMTPEYAAPEQVRGEAVTTATDVYALGVVLYELLAGQRPYDVA
ncbi:MAG: serine/threonine-protein kinase, partial [Bacteroidota bacterium]